MTSDYARDMAKATELTRSGKLLEATHLIQSLLQPHTAESLAPDGRDTPDDKVIEGVFTRLNPDAQPENPAAEMTKPPRSKMRTPLSETLRRIARGGMPASRRKSGGMVPIPEGAQFLSLTHTASEGSRTYRLYIPANAPKGLMPLIVMLHGCTQSPEDFALGTGMNILAEEFGCLIAYPAQPSGANMQKCWNWYRPEDQTRGKGEPALIAGLTRDIQRDYPADPARTYVAGLSAGGAAAVVVAAAYPEVFAAVGVHSGLPAGGASDVPSAFAAMRSGARSSPHQAVVPTIVFHGSADSTVHPTNGAQVLSQAIQAMPADLVTKRHDGMSKGGRPFRTTAYHHAKGHSLAEHWQIDGAGHAWAGGHVSGTYTDPAGPDASREMIRFFLQHKTT